MLGQRSRSATRSEHPDSPPRKRPRHSDPPLASQLSQSSFQSTQSTAEARARRAKAIADALSGSQAPEYDRSAEVPNQGSLDNSEHTSVSPPLEDHSYDDWFAPSMSQAIFVPASQLPEAANLVPRTKGDTWRLPSKDALEQASQRLDQWTQEIETAEALPTSSNEPPQRPVFAALENTGPSQRTTHTNSLVQPKKITPASFRTPLLSHVPQTPVRPDRGALNPKVGLPGTVSRQTYQNSPLNPRAERSQPIAAGTSSAAFPSLTSQIASTPHKLGLGMTPRARISSMSRPTFTTPFKTNRKPAEPIQSLNRSLNVLSSPLRKNPEVLIKNVAAEKVKGSSNSVFDLSYPGVRLGMKKSGVAPGAYKITDLIQHAIPENISTITLQRAPYYRFQAVTGHPDESCGMDTAYDDLLLRGCDLLTRSWVDNHWALVLWKLASLVCSSPGLFQPKWNYPEVLHQLLYRYEREINRAQRPPIRLITERDISSTKPLVLCVSGIIETGNEPQDQHGGKSLPLLEVTDGWYKLRAAIDPCLSRALKRGVLGIGMKISVSGARLEGAKDGVEPLKAYDKVHLSLSGNSTALARWDTKLGFQPRPFVATLRSLSPDGGVVMLMDIVIAKAFPIGYIDMDGDRTPRCEAEEREAAEMWKTRYADEESKLQNILEKKVNTLEGLAERLGARGIPPPPDDDAPSHVEDLYEELEESETPALVAKDISPSDAGWLALMIKRKCLSMREGARDLISRELEGSFSPRNVRNFRVIRFRDHQVEKRQSARIGQLTVWDVLSLGENAMMEGKRYMVTNLVPSQPKAWQHHDVEGEAYFNTRKDSRWISPNAPDS